MNNEYGAKILVINCNCSKNLDHCGGAGVPVSQFCGREGGSISNPFISFQQSQLFAECNRTQFSAQQKYFSAKYSGDLAQILGLDYTCALGPSSDYWAVRVVPCRAWRSYMSTICKMTFFISNQGFWLSVMLGACFLQHHWMLCVCESQSPLDMKDLIVKEGIFKFYPFLQKKGNFDHWLGKEGTVREIEHIMRGNWSLLRETGLGWKRKRCKVWHDM